MFCLLFQDFRGSLVALSGWWNVPGKVVVPHGASAHIDAQTGIDLAGADNILTSSSRTTNPFLNSWNSNLVQYEKHDGSIELEPDCRMKPAIISV